MCGVVGIVGSLPERREKVEQMVHLVHHRGPDERGIWETPTLTLGHTRLRIIDLSPSGSQPMRRGELVVSFNGEIYNWRRLREELEAQGVQFRSQSDTEVLLAMYERFGIGMLERFEGMFAFALWDGAAQTLHLVRDRYGVKPLLYSVGRDYCVFASELRCFEPFPDLQTLDVDALSAYLSTNYIPAPRTIWSGVRRLPPGSRLEIRPGLPTGDPIKWFDPVKTVQFNGRPSAAEAAERLGAVLRDAVGLRLQADVPVGVFLSGGIDSSIVAALAVEESRSVTTLTVGYADVPEYDERAAARLMATALGTDHREILVTHQEAQQAVVEVLERIDEPFADSSLVPSYLLSKVARREVVAVLSGDGGDELFGGYTKYLGSRWAGLPGVTAARKVAALTSLLPEGRSTRALNMVRILRRFARGVEGNLAERQRAWVSVLDYETARSLANIELTDEDSLFRDLSHLLARTGDWDDAIQRVLMADVSYVLPFDMLEKVDRASMWNSLEVRSPFLDSRVLPLAFAFPGTAHVGLFQTKRVLRSLFRNELPPAILRRGKRGFGIPLGVWMRGSLRWLLDDYLDPTEIRKVGLLSEPAVKSLVEEHLGGRKDRSWELWNAIVLQVWASRNPWSLPS